MIANKRFAQNFLINNKIAIDIVDLLEINEDDFIIEVGPGRGVLTKIILNRTKNALFIELDKTMCDFLNSKLNLNDKLINSDFLKINLSTLSNGKKIKIIGNFPYNISGKLIHYFYKNKDIIKLVVGMFQKEVVDRLIANPGKKTYGIPTIFTKMYYNVNKVFDIDPSNFIPEPKIKSSVFTLERNEVENVNCNEKLLEQIIKLSFSSRRKTIKNNLKYNDFYKFIDEKLLNNRAETLSLEDFISITNSIEKKIN